MRSILPPGRSQVFDSSGVTFGDAVLSGRNVTPHGTPSPVATSWVLTAALCTSREPESLGEHPAVRTTATAITAPQPHLARRRALPIIGLQRRATRGADRHEALNRDRLGRHAVRAHPLDSRPAYRQNPTPCSNFLRSVGTSLRRYA